MNNLNSFYKKNHNKKFHHHFFTWTLIFVVPLFAFISISSFIYGNPQNKNNILGASTQVINGNTNTSFINSSGFNVVNGIIYKSGSQIALHGVNWFGFETDWHVVHGVDHRSYTAFMDQMKTIGVNAVRIPLCPDSIHGTDPLYIDYSQNPDLQNLNSIELLDKFMTEFANRGIYVLLDLHRPDCSSQSALWYTNTYSESQWIADLKSLATRYKTNNYFIGIDLKNEPYSPATWGAGNSNTDWNTAAERAGNAVLSVNSNILIFVEGVSQSSNCTGSTYTNWGGDFEPFNCFPISAAQIPYNKLVLSPHVYGPDVANQSYFSDPSFPNNLPTVLNTQFGYLKDRYFAISPGEWGGKYGNGGLALDKTWQDAFASYLISKGICNSFYWSWNPDSGDTGGILKDDWTTLWSNKVQLLSNYFNKCKQSIAVSTATPTPTSTSVPSNTFTSNVTTTKTSVTPLNSTLTNSPASCLCNVDVCSNSCTFSNNSSNAGYKCSRETGLGDMPSQQDKDNYCKNSLRNLGDTNNDGVIDNLDYIYYVRVVNGGTLPSNVFPDANGDGNVSVSDRDIIIANVSK